MDTAESIPNVVATDQHECSPRPALEQGSGEVSEAPVVSTTVDSSGLKSRIDRVLADQRTRLNFAAAAQQGLSESIRAEILPASTGGAGRKVSGSKIGDRTGALRQALTPGGKGNIAGHQIVADSVEAFLGIDSSAVPYWRIHEEGGVLRARNGKYLIIPLNDRAEKLAASGSARNAIPGSFVVESKRGYLFIVTKEGEGLAFWFRLAEQVKISKRPYVAKGVKRFEKTLPKLGKQVRIDIKAAWDAA